MTDNVFEMICQIEESIEWFTWPSPHKDIVLSEHCLSISYHFCLDGSGEAAASQAKPEDEPQESVGEAIQVAKVKPKPKDLSTQLKKEHVNIVFIGHVDAGKSTIGGRVL